MNKKGLVIRALLIASLGFIQFPATTARAESFDKEMESYLTKDDNVEKLGNALERYFMKKRQQAQESQAKAEADKMEQQFKNPVKVDAGESPVRGKPDAKVTIVSFSDFQCPFCSRGASTMEEIMKAYPNDVKLVFKNLPLPFHQEAKPAARAALAAYRQGKFWEMHDQLFKNQQALGKDLYVKIAEDLGLDVEKFKKDMEDEKLEKTVEEDAALATKLGVQGTPGYFVNGVLVSGAQPFPQFKLLIDRWLKGK
jgi:protein-disulfide isomerase